LLYRLPTTRDKRTSKGELRKGDETSAPSSHGGRDVAENNQFTTPQGSDLSCAPPAVVNPILAGMGA
jgi:hypothetical protein